MFEQVAIRAFFPVWICLYVGQFVLWYLIRGDHWYSSSIPLSIQRSPDGSPRVSLFLGNTLYLVAFSYYVVIFFLGYNGMSAVLFRMLSPLYLSIVKKIS